MSAQEKFKLRLSLLENEEWLDGTEEDFQNYENAKELFRRLNLLWNNFEYCVGEED